MLFIIQVVDTEKFSVSTYRWSPITFGLGKGVRSYHCGKSRFCDLCKGIRKITTPITGDPVDTNFFFLILGHKMCFIMS